MRFPRWFIGPAKELRRPSFPVEPKYTEVRGHVDRVKPVIRVKRKPIDYDAGLPIG